MAGTGRHLSERVHRLSIVDFSQKLCASILSNGVSGLYQAVHRVGKCYGGSDGDELISGGFYILARRETHRAGGM
jgi:hypothetical protein